MFDRFTDHAKQTMNLARQEAQRFNHQYLGTEHILLGVLQLDDSCAVAALRKLGVDLIRVRTEVEKIVKRGDPSVALHQLPFTPRAKRVLELSMEAAGNLGHNYIGSEHILLGLVREGEGVAAQVLHALGVTPASARSGVLDALGHRVTGGPGRAVSPSESMRKRAIERGPSGEFTGRLADVWSVALREAVATNHEVLRTEHVLTALLRERGGVAAHVLRELSLDEQRILATLQAASQPGSVPTSLDRIGVDPGVRDALTFASEEARAHGRELIGTGHLLVGLMREKMGVAAQVLSTVHLEPERVRALVIQCLRRIEDDPIWDLIG